MVRVGAVIPIAVVKVKSPEVETPPVEFCEPTLKWYVVFEVRPVSVIACEVTREAEVDAVP